MAQLCRRLGMSLHAGVDLRRIWEQEAQRGSPGHRQQMERISRRVNSGDSVAEAWRECDGYFPALACELVDVGEQTGKLDEVLLRLADHYDHMLQLRRTFLVGITWPSIQLGAAILIVGLLIWIMGMLAPPHGEPIRIFGLAGTSGLLIYLLVVGLTAGAIGLAVMSIVRGWFGPAPMQLAMRLPVIGKCLQTMALARLAWSLAMALESGVDARRSIRLALRSTHNSYYTSHLDSVDRQVIRGKEFHEILRATQAFPDEFLDSLEAAELSGTHSESMLRLSREYQARAESASKMLTVAASFAIWALVALILIMLIFQFFFAFILNPIQEGLDALP